MASSRVDSERTVPDGRTGGESTVQVAPRGRAVSWLLLAGLIVIGLAPPVVFGAVSGAFGIPHNDDWSFIRSATTLHDTGRIQLVGWSQMTMVGQLYLAQPVLLAVHGIGGMQIMTITLTVLGAVAAFVLGRRIHGDGAGLLLTAAFLCCPLVAPLTVTYMTDLPALAFEIGALAVGMVAIGAAGRARAALFVLALVLALAGVTIRETAAPAAAGVLASMLARWWFRRRTADLVGVLAGGVGFGVALLVFLHWRHGLPLGIGYGVAAGRGQFFSLLRMFATLALFLLPVLVWPTRERAGLRGRGIGAVVGGVLALVLGLHAGTGRALIGNYLQYPSPLQPVMRGAEPETIPPVFWQVVAVIALCSLVILGIRLADLVAWFRTHRFAQLRSRPAAGIDGGAAAAADRSAAWFGVTVAAVCALGVDVVGASQGKTYDRYLMPVAFLFAAAMLVNLRGLGDRRERATAGAGAGPVSTSTGGVRLAKAGSVALLVASLGLGFVLTAVIDNFDAARWKAGEAAVALGADPASIDAGFEWISYHQTGPAYQTWARDDMTLPSWVRRMHAYPCWSVSVGPLKPPPDRREMQRIPWRDAFGTMRTLIIYRDDRPNCDG